MALDDTIDVVIPTHNETSRLHAALLSVRQQSLYSNVVKIIVIDDGSSPEIINEIMSYRALSKKIKIILHDRILNPGRLRSIAIQESNSRLIAFLDADDVWSNDRLQVGLEHLKNHKCKAVAANATVVKKPKSTPYFVDVAEKSYGTYELLRRNIVITSTLLIETELLKAIGNFASDYNMRGVEDYSTWLRVSTKSNFCFLDISVANYSVSPFGLSSSGNKHNRFYAFTDFIDWTINSNSIADKTKNQILIEIQEQFNKLPVKKFRYFRLKKYLETFLLAFVNIIYMIYFHSYHFFKA
jgi:glycosyltransferase involved in cell wall biosynthesis